MNLNLFSGGAGRVSLLAVATCALLPPAAHAEELGAEEANLSPRLEELASREVRKAPASVQAARLGLPARGAGSLLRSGGRLLVNVRFDDGAAQAVDELLAVGAEVVELSEALQMATVAVKPADLEALTRVPGVAGITEVLAPLISGADCGGVVRSEGDTQLQAAGARAKWGVDGSGVTVGVLSDTFDHAPGAATHAGGDVASGDLPGSGSPCGSSQPVGILNDPFLGTDEGRAMAQVVHDLAPGAAIDFATAVSGELSFAASIRALANAGARVIADDVTYPEEPFFQDGPVAQAVNEVTAGGVSYFSAVGNNNLIDGMGRDVSSWEAPAFRDSGSCPAAIGALSEEVEEAEEENGELPPQGLHPTHCMDFDPGPGEDTTFGITVEAEEPLRIDLQWAEPWFGVKTNLDAFLLNENGELLEPEVNGHPTPVVSLADNIAGSQTPFEFLFWQNPDEEEEVQLVVNSFGSSEPPPPPPRLKFVLVENGGGVSAIEHPDPIESDTVGPAIFGHAAAQSAIGVGAVRFDQTAAPEAFSSRGPVKHYFGPVTGETPAVPTGEQEIAKPDLVATDCGVTTFFSFFVGGKWRFCGTSAAAPHAAAAAALVRQANPGASAALVRTVLEGTAHPVGAFGPAAVGAGLLDADAAVNLLALPPQITILRQPAPLSRDRRPSLEFAANRPVAFACSVDGAAAQPCASPFAVPTELADGTHAIAVTGTDLAGRVGGGSTQFRIDTRAPQTFIVAHPAKLLRTHRRRARAVFRFRSDEAGVAFSCKIDRGPFRPCAGRLSRRYPPGRHIVKARAQDVAGNADPSAAAFRFKVVRIG